MRAGKAKLPEPQSWLPAPQVRPLPTANGHTTILWSGRDSLAGIARDCGVSVTQLLDLNNLGDGDLQIGQALRVPTPVEPKAKCFDPAAFAETEVWRGIRGRKQIALTFDAGGENDGANNLISFLRGEHVAATFFVTGEFVRSNPDILKEIADAGLAIHNHSWSHPEFTKLDDRKMEAELGKTDEIVKQVTGNGTRPYWRPPYGDRDRRVLKAASAAGFQSIYWTLDSLDSFGERKSAEFIVKRILEPPKHRDPDRFLDGAIILMHVGEPGTVEAVPELVRGLRDRGFSLVTVDQLLTP